jgi:hypothetical protein
MSDMTKNPDDTSKELDAVLKALQRSLVEASNDDVIKRLQTAGIDPLKAMETMRFAEDKALEEHFRHVREELAEQRAEAVRKIDGVRGRLPASRKERLDLLRNVYATQAQTLTAQFREMTSPDDLSDAELEGMLQHFAALGYVSPGK